MFRTKKKKAGNATRKRKDLDEDDEIEAPSVEVSKMEPMEVDDGGIAGSNDAVSAGNDPEQPTTEPVEEEEEEEIVMLERMRTRMQKTKGGGAGAMSFSSKAVSARKMRRVVLNDDDGEERDDGVATTTAPPVGSLSFEDDDVRSSAKKSKLRIRPNLSVSHATEEADAEETTTNLYSEDMMAALLREQKVLLRHSVRSEAAEMAVEDVEMDADETERQAREAVDEEMKGQDEEDADAEEFIPLSAKLLKTKKNKKRVTFGVHNDEFYPPKSAEVDEPVTASEGEEGDEDEANQSKRWEEELMRRGGGHNVQYQAPKTAQSGGYGSKLTYPTRKSVPCASLGEVMRSIQKKINAGSFERDRVARELARLDVETELIQKKLVEQREELLVCSEQFEYFQVVEDFVKGLSFCLREKLPEIEREERKRASVLLAATQALQTQRSNDVNDEIRQHVEGSTLQRRHFTNFPQLPSQVDGHGDDPGARLSRLRRGYHSQSPVDSSPFQMDAFADALDEFSSLANVYGRFQEWKAKFPDVYKNAYCDLALSKLYAPYIRAEIIDWDPLSLAAFSKSSQPHSQRVSEMSWFKTLRLHHQSLQSADLEEPLPSILRETIIARVADATKSRLDAFSSDHVQSIIDFIEDLAQLNAIKYVEHGLEEVITTVLKKFTDEAKQFPLLALNDEEASNDRLQEFAAFLVGEFCALLENALTFFVALPSGPFHQHGFNAIMLVLHQLLAYVNHCQREHKTAMLPRVSRTIQQLSASSFMQSILARSTREQFEFQRVLHLLTSSTNGKSAT